MAIKSKIFSGITMAAAVAAFSFAAIAQDPVETKPEGRQHKERFGGKRGEGFGKGFHKGKKKGFRGGKHGGFGLRGIELTDVQKEQIKAIREANKPDPALREEMKTIMQARRSGTITEDQKARVQSLMAQQREKGESVRLQIEALLTPEQKQQLETQKAEREQRMQERRERMKQHRENFKNRSTTPAEKTDN